MSTRTKETTGCTEYDITTTSRDLTPDNLYSMIESGIIDTPIFQRNYVWDIKKASRLIESIMLGLPIPELFFYTHGDEDGTYKIIDGQQRVLTIYFFLIGKFPRSNLARIMLRDELVRADALKTHLSDVHAYKEFKLDLEESNPLNGKSFADLDEDLKVKFKLRRYLHTVVIRQNSSDVNNQAMFQIFSRLNTGGTILTNQEIRASLYYCPFYELLLELNELEAWRKLICKPVKGLHGEDVEIILRALALADRYETYSPKMVFFLNSFSQASIQFSEQELNSYRNMFMHFLAACESLEHKAFYKSNRFSKTLFESTFVAVCKTFAADKSEYDLRIVPESLEQLKNDEVFNEYLLADSTAADNTKGRINRAIEIIKVQ